jgi:N-acetyl-anhydromuramyl-L-alanine amidase AmpD
MKAICSIADSQYVIDALSVADFSLKPSGVTVHYTADGSLERLKREMGATKIGYHLIIDRDGTIIQTASMLKRVNHAGLASWNGKSPNRTHLAVAFISWGRLNAQGQAWTGLQIQNPVTRAQGMWDAASPAQEKSLTKVLTHLINEYKISPLEICGHDECSLPTGRKIDPGGSLSKSMAQLRNDLMIKKGLIS